MGYKFAQYDSVVSPGPGQLARTVLEGQAWFDDDPVVVANPGLFADQPRKVFASVDRLVVEQASAAPGEKRRGR